MFTVVAAYLAFASLRPGVGVTIDAVGSVDDIVTQVSKIVGQKLVVDPEVGCINAYVKLADAGLDEFKQRLAQVTRATWIEKPGISRLKRTPEQDRQIQQERLAVVVPQMEERLAALQPRLTDSDFHRPAKALEKGLRDEAERQGRLNFVGPADALLNELLIQMGAKRIAELPLIRNHVFSNRPTAPEGNLAGAGDLVPRFIDLTHAFAQDVNDESLQSALDKGTFDRIVTPAHAMKSVGRVLLTMYPTMRSVSSMLAVFDSDGKLVVLTTGNFVLPALDTKVELPNGSETIAWSNAAKSAVADLSQATGSRLDAARISAILDEPLNIQAVPGLRAIAASRTPNIVCPLPDTAVISMFRVQPVTVNDYASNLGNSGVRLRIDGDWLVGDVSPGYFDPFYYMGRPALHHWVSSAIKKSQTWLRRTSVLYAQAGDAASNGLMNWIQRFAWPKLGIVEPLQLVPRWILKALGTCSTAEWDEFGRGGSVSVNGSPDRVRNVEQWSWQSAVALEWINGAAGPDVERIGSFAFPGGPPETATIGMANRSDRVVGVTIDGKLFWMEMSQFANWLCVKSLPRPDNQEAALKAANGSYKLGLRPSGKIVVNMSPAQYLQCDQPEGEIAVVKEPASISAWPPEFIDEFKTAIREYLDERVGSTRPPPP